MRISHIQTTDKPSSIIVRNYDNKSIVLVPNYIIREYYKPLEDEIGQFRIKYKDKCFGHFAQRDAAIFSCGI